MLEASEHNIQTAAGGRAQGLQEIVEDQRENMTDTAIKRQREMDMAANLNNPEQPREELKESSDEVEVKTNRRRKNISLGIGIFLIIAIIVTVSVLLAIYLTKKQERVKVRVSMKRRNQLSLSKKAKMSAETLALSDLDLMGEGEELQIFVNEVESTSSLSDGGRLLQQTTTSTATLEVHDPYTDTTVSVNSDTLQAEVGVALNSILAFVLNNQPVPDLPPPPPDNLQADGEDLLMAAGQEETAFDRTITYYTVNEKLETAITEALRESGAVNVRPTLEKSYDADITADGLLEIVAQDGLQSSDPEIAREEGALFTKSPRFVRPSTNVTLDDLFNETQIAAAAARVVRDVVLRIKEIIRKHLALIEKEAGVNLKSVDPTDGETSLYMDDPADVQKGCSQLSDGGLRCTEGILQSGLLELTTDLAAGAVREVPQLLLKLTL